MCPEPSKRMKYIYAFTMDERKKTYFTLRPLEM